jgi:transcriptional regulator with XRE-family HTH domain
MVGTKGIFARQAKAARELMGWTQDDLAKITGLSPGTIKNYENGKTQTVGTTAAIRQAFEKAGIVFVLESEGNLNRVGVIRTEKD